ncbi:MAG: hypothetical protein ACYDCQ_20285 [Dehalococcoidia bacterium]
MSSRTSGDGEEAGRALAAVVIAVGTASAICGRFLFFWAVELIAATFQAYGRLPVVRYWAVLSAAATFGALGFAWWSASLIAWIAVGLTVAVAFASLSLLKHSLDRLAALPAKDQELQLGDDWHDA